MTASDAPPTPPSDAPVVPDAEGVPPLRAAQYLLLASILLVAGATRVYRIGSQSLWRDELFSLELSTGRGLGQEAIPRDHIIMSLPDLTSLRDAPPWTSVLGAMRDDTHPPLYPLLLRFWRSIFGEGDVAARSLSALWSVLGIVLLFDAVRHLHDVRAALWAAAVMALAAPQIQYAQEARGYAMAVTLVLGCCAVVARIDRRGGAAAQRCVILAALLLLTMGTNYGAAPALFAIAIYAAFRLRGRDVARVFATFTTAALIYLVLWGPMLWHQRPNFSANMIWTLEPRDENLRNTPARILDLPIRFLFTPVSTNIALTRILALVYIAPLFLLRRRPALLLWWMMLIFVVGAVAASDLSRSANLLTMIRYTLVASPAVYVILVVMLGGVRGTIGQLAPAVIVLGCALALPNAYAGQNADYRGFGRYVYRHAKPQDLLVFVGTERDFWQSALLHMSVTHYHAADAAGHGSPCPVLMTTTGPPSPALLDEIRAWPGAVWVIEPWSAGAGGTLPGSHYVEGEFVPNVGTVTRVAF